MQSSVCSWLVIVKTSLLGKLETSLLARKKVYTIVSDVIDMKEFKSGKLVKTDQTQNAEIAIQKHASETIRIYVRVNNTELECFLPLEAARSLGADLIMLTNPNQPSFT